MSTKKAQSAQRSRIARVDVNSSCPLWFFVNYVTGISHHLNKHDKVELDIIFL